MEPNVTWFEEEYGNTHQLLVKASLSLNQIKNDPYRCQQSILKRPLNDTNLQRATKRNRNLQDYIYNRNCICNHNDKDCVNVFEHTDFNCTDHESEDRRHCIYDQHEWEDWGEHRDAIRRAFKRHGVNDPDNKFVDKNSIRHYALGLLRKDVENCEKLEGNATDIEGEIKKKYYPV